MKSLLRSGTAYVFAACFTAVATFAHGTPSGQGTAFQMAVAENAATKPSIAEFYRRNGYQPIWTGETEDHIDRRGSLINALVNAEMHGLPSARYDVDALLQKMRNARTVRDLGLIEAELSSVFVKYAGDVQSGVLEPAKIDAGLVRKITRLSAADHLEGLMSSEGGDYFDTLAPQSLQYRALLKQKKALEHLLDSGGWGETIPIAKYEMGDSGPGVIKLRNRLVALGYLKPNASPVYDDTLLGGVQAFQADHGLATDGVAGQGTVSEINQSVSLRLKSVVVALERERWLPRERGERHILVNQADFSAKIVDDGRVTFQTRAVIGKNTHDRRSPEFSDQMEHMVINPSWHVPRSIITKEYLPQLRENPNAVGHLEITDRQGRRISREAVDFNQFTPSSFPFAMRQPPGRRNALGLVKFMFPNKHNIYLHDTPQKSLFSREVRAFSHGCIRLAQPFEFAYVLLALQEDNPKSFFHGVLNTGREATVKLEKPVPVHLIYRTAYIGPKGEVQYRRDVYNRDKKIWDALQKAGVALPGVQG